jgi:hypothetical protein
MMSEKMALKVAIDLLHVPSQVRLVRSEPLADGVLTLLRIAAGDDEAEHTAAATADRPREVIRRAAVFFIEQILFAPDTDSYRALGADPRAHAGELRRNAALLLRWLHPDLDALGERSIFVSRVTEAWNNLKTPERRAAYDDLLLYRQARSNRRSISGRSRLGKQSGGLVMQNGQRSAKPKHLRARDGVGFFRRALSVLFNRPLF